MDPPACSSRPAKTGLDATTAFGTGRHETTQLCLTALEEWIRPDKVVADVGCGSGILSAAAKLLGVQRVCSCDIDEAAVHIAGRHAAVPLFIGSADALSDASADLVLANISAAVLERLAFDIRRIMKPGGLAVLSGFTEDRVPESYRPWRVLESGGWLCWICRTGDIEPLNAPSTEGISHAVEWWL